LEGSANTFRTSLAIDPNNTLARENLEQVKREAPRETSEVRASAFAETSSDVKFLLHFFQRNALGSG